jgi:hypothetical protein
MKSLLNTSCEVVKIRGNGLSSRPALVLFGWSGGSVAHLQKHVRVWEGEVNEIVLVAVPIGVLRMVPEDEVVKRVKNVISQIDSTSKVFLHVFSNGYRCFFGGFFCSFLKCFFVCSGLLYGSRAILLLGERVKVCLFFSLLLSSF